MTSNNIALDSTIRVEGYDLVAMCVCDLGRVIVLSNNDNYLLVALQENEEATTAVLRETFRYDVEPFRVTFTKALASMQRYALANLSFEDGE